MCHQGQVVNKGNRRNKGIIWANTEPLRSEISMFSSSFIKRQAAELARNVVTLLRLSVTCVLR